MQLNGQKKLSDLFKKGLKEFHVKLFLALVLASRATRPHLGVSEDPLNPQFQGLKINLCGYRHPNYFSRLAPDNTDSFREYYQTILTYLELISNSTHTLTKLIPNNSKHFFESFNGHLNRQKILKEKNSKSVKS